ncbi:MAG: hypothetical protein KDK91_19380 [Gammaproteobacteria bacterium]|nr:hypothetical protein [Gammaproteobacteria bacterium]
MRPASNRYVCAERCRRIGRGGFSLVEMLLVLALGTLLLVPLLQALSGWLALGEAAATRADLGLRAQYAMQRMTRAVQRSRLLILPDALNTQRNENGIPDECDPDCDADGVPDADNDGDGRIDEDWPSDMGNDGRHGVRGVDDDADGQVDEAISVLLLDLAQKRDDDEDGQYSEDPRNGLDDDGDGRVDEDTGADMNGDGAPGVAGVDDDGDGLIDEGDSADDDEDGVSDEDWLDVVVFRLSGTDLYEDLPIPGASDASSVESRLLCANVSSLNVRRSVGASGAVLVSISLTLSGTDGVSVSLAASVRLGAGL